MSASKRPNARRILLYLFGASLLVLADPVPIWFAAGTALALPGEALRLWAAGHLEKNRTLTRSGPYAHVAHPFYLGSLILFAGFVVAGFRPELPGALLLWAGAPIGLVAFFLFYFPRKQRIESNRLRRRFGEDYERYARSVPSLWPRLRGVPTDGRRWRWHRVIENSEHWTAICLALGFLSLAARL